MSTTPSPLTSSPSDALSVLTTIANTLTQVKGSAALSHYHSRRAWVARLNEALEGSVDALKRIRSRVTELLSSDADTSSVALDPKSEFSLFRKIVPVMLNNHISLADRYIKGTRPEPRYAIQQEPYPSKSFDDFSQLTTLTRQYVDSTIQDAYQLAQLDAKEFNFNVLNSLHSFVHLATRSLQVPFMSAELASTVNWFDSLSWKKRKNSVATSCQKERFGDRVDFLVSALNPQLGFNVGDAAKATFKFCSEFTHVGYVSTLVTSRERGEVYMGSVDDCFFSSTENYVELEYILLKGACLVFIDLYLRALDSAASRLLNVGAYSEISALLKSAIEVAGKSVKLTGRSLTQFVSKRYEGAPQNLVSKCICGESRVWSAPFEPWFNYCNNCGTQYGIVEWPTDIGYVIVPQGPCDVFGSIHPVIDDLSQVDRDRVYELWEHFKRNERAKKIETEYLHPALAIRDLKAFTLPDYSLLGEKLHTLVSGKKLSENDGVPIFCNCGCVAVIKRGFGEDSFECFGCGSTITMRVLDGDSGYALGYDADGTPRLIPVQGSDAKSPNELTPQERKEILDSMLAATERTKRQNS